MKVHDVTPAEKSWVETTIEDNRRIYEERNKNILHMRRMRTLKLSGKTPRAFQSLLGKGVRVPMSWALVQTVTGMVTKNTPRFTRVPLGESDKDASRRIANAAWPLIQTYSKLAREELYFLTTDNLTADGSAVVKLRRSQLDGYPVQDTGERDKEFNKRVEDFLNDPRVSPALRISRVDPMTFMSARGTYDLDYVIESGRRPIKQTLRKAGIRFNRQGKLEPIVDGATMPEDIIPAGISEHELVEELWTDDSMYLRVGGQEVIRIDNEFGFIPFRSRKGMSTSIPDPAFDGVSVIYPFTAIEPWLNTLMSVVMGWSVLGGTPILAVETAAGAGPTGAELPLADIPLGKQVSLGAGKTIKFVTPPPVGREVIEAIELMMNIYDKAGVTSMARGFIGTRTAGTAYDSALEQAGAMLGQLVRGEEGILEDIVELTLRGAEKLGVPLYITGDSIVEKMGGSTRVRAPHVISPKDIKGYYDIHCELKLANLQDMMSRGMHAAMMKAHGIWQDDRVMEFSGVDDPDAERLGKLKDKIRNSPVYQSQVLKPALMQDEEMAAVVEQAEQAGVPLSQLLEQGGLPPQAGGGAPQESEGIYGGAPQPRGGKAPQGGGKVAGGKKRPGGTRGATPGERFPQG